MSRSRIVLLACLLLVVAGAVGGCASSGAQVCRIDPLVHPEIRFDDEAHRYLFDDHIYFSKEASSGGQGSGGGGCGCN